MCKRILLAFPFSIIFFYFLAFVFNVFHFYVDSFVKDTKINKYLLKGKKKISMNKKQKSLNETSTINAHLYSCVSSNTYVVELLITLFSLKKFWKIAMKNKNKWKIPLPLLSWICENMLCSVHSTGWARNIYHFYSANFF